MDPAIAGPTSNPAVAGPKIGNPEGLFSGGRLVPPWRDCSSVTRRFWPGGSESRLASRPPENSAPIPYL